MQITIEELCTALYQYLQRGGNAKGLVFVEGCDCVGSSAGISAYGEGIVIRRLTTTGDEIRDRLEIITGKNEGKKV